MKLQAPTQLTSVKTEDLKYRVDATRTRDMNDEQVEVKKKRSNFVTSGGKGSHIG